MTTLLLIMQKVFNMQTLVRDGIDSSYGHFTVLPVQE